MLALSVQGFIWQLVRQAADITVKSTFSTSYAAIGRDIAVGLYVVFRVYRRGGGMEAVVKHIDNAKDAFYAIAAAFVLTFFYHLVITVPGDVRDRANIVQVPPIAKPSMTPPEFAYSLTLRPRPRGEDHSNAERAALTVDSTYLPDPYFDGATANGLTWAANMVDLRIFLKNTDPVDYDEVTLTISTNLLILGSAQVSGDYRVEMSPISNMGPGYLTLQTPDGKRGIGSTIGSPVIFSSKYALYCKRFGRKSNIELTLQLISPPIDEQGRMTNMSVHGFGGERKIPSWIKIDGTFDTEGIKHKVDFTKRF